MRLKKLKLVPNWFQIPKFLKFYCFTTHETAPAYPVWRAVCLQVEAESGSLLQAASLRHSCDARRSTVHLRSSSLMIVVFSCFVRSTFLFKTLLIFINPRARKNHFKHLPRHEFKYRTHSVTSSGGRVDPVIPGPPRMAEHSGTVY